MEILVVKTINKLLKPAFDEDLEKFNKLPKDGYFEIKYTAKRNVKFHRKFFALIKLAFENQEAYSCIERMRKDIIKHAGFFEEYVNAITGEITQESKSISFSSMNENEFNDVYEKSKKVICDWLGVDNESIENEISQYF